MRSDSNPISGNYAQIRAIKFLLAKYLFHLKITIHLHSTVIVIVAKNMLRIIV